MRRLLPLLMLVAGLHLALSLGLSFVSFSTTMARFDSGRPASGLERVTYVASDVLRFPIVNGIMDRSFGRSVARALGTPGEYLIFIGNSFLWASVVLALLAAWKRRRGTTPLNGSIVGRTDAPSNFHGPAR
jgi:hypothetical protein